VRGHEVARAVKVRRILTVMIIGIFAWLGTGSALARTAEQIELWAKVGDSVKG
jgi:hypothetical protein